jgi:two-component system sensor histidine kinase VanS
MVIAEWFFVFCVKLAENELVKGGFKSQYMSRDGINPSLKFGLFIAFGVIVFIVSFIGLLKGSIDYIKEISEGVQKISKGDLKVIIPIRGNDEFSKIALSLNAMTEELILILNRERAAEKSKNDLITSVAHDLRTPLTSIIGYLDLIKRKPELDEETREKYIEIAYNKSKRLENLTNDLFGFTKLNHGQMTVELRNLNLVQLLRQLLDEFYPSIEERQLECEFKSSDSNIFVEGDGNLLARLFDNLISNAIKYGSEGKTIIVEIRKLEDYRVSIQVINYGKIIPKYDLEHLFDKFYRVDSSRSPDTGGTGLGLAIAKSITKMHGGTIEARSDVHGTVFEVILYTDFQGNIKKFEGESG